MGILGAWEKFAPRLVFVFYGFGFFFVKAKLKGSSCLPFVNLFPWGATKKSGFGFFSWAEGRGSP